MDNILCRPGIYEASMIDETLGGSVERVKKVLSVPMTLSISRLIIVNQRWG
jgi:hypothetical protein